MFVISARDDGEETAVHMDRAWLTVRMLAADPVGRSSREGAECAWRTARAWSLWYHMGCDYDASIMRAVRLADAHAHVHVHSVRVRSGAHSHT